jgi:hypothetical protein
LPQLSRIDREWRSIIRLTSALGGSSAQVGVVPLHSALIPQGYCLTSYPREFREIAGRLRWAVFQNSAWLAQIQIDCTQSKFVATSGAAAPADDHRHSGPRV